MILYEPAPPSKHVTWYKTSHGDLDRPGWCNFNTLRPRQNLRHFPDDIFKCIFFNENVWYLNKIPLKFVPKGPIYNIPALVQIMAWCRPGDTPLSDPMMVSLLTHICVTRPQWGNTLRLEQNARYFTGYIFSDENVSILIQISLKLFPCI